nr:tombus P33-like protein [Tolivirales sp.]
MDLYTLRCGFWTKIFRINMYVVLLSLCGLSVWLMPITGIVVTLLLQKIWEAENVPEEHPLTLSTMAVVEAVFDDEDTPDGPLENDVDLFPAASKNELSVRRSRRSPYIGRVALIVKSHVGTLPLTKANKLVVQRLARDAMKEHGLRPTHIARMLPLVVAASFMRTDEDDLADSMLARMGKCADEERK